MIVVTGSELVRGERTDLNGPFLARSLLALGVEPARIQIVGDDPAELEAAVRDAVASAELVACSGGLGPTHDDRTVEVVARVAGRPLRTDEELEAQIEGVSRMAAERMKRPYADFAQGVTKQATVPEGADVLGLAGTAPGLVVEADGTPVIVLPGPPPELQRLWPRALETEGVRRVLDRGKPPLRRTLRFFGPGESQVAQAFQEAGGDGDGLEVTICARSFEIHVDLVADPSEEGRMLELQSGLEERLGRFLYSTDGRTVEEIVLDRCRERGWKLATAESCTGGLIAAAPDRDPRLLRGGPGRHRLVRERGEDRRARRPGRNARRARRRLGGGRGGDGARRPRAPRRRRRDLGHRRRRPWRRHRGEARGARLLPRGDPEGRAMARPSASRATATRSGVARSSPPCISCGECWNRTVTIPCDLGG